MNETEGNTERNENEFNYPRAVVRAGAVCGKLVFFSWKKKKKKKVVERLKVAANLLPSDTYPSLTFLILDSDLVWNPRRGNF